jgi:hypothetical protein
MKDIITDRGKEFNGEGEKGSQRLDAPGLAFDGQHVEIVVAADQRGAKAADNRSQQVHVRKLSTYAADSCIESCPLLPAKDRPNPAAASTLGAQVRRALGVGRRQSMVSSSLREYRNLFVKAANFLTQADAATHPPKHRESVLRCWLQAASLETDSLLVPLVPRSQNRGLHLFPIQAPYLRYSKASFQFDYDARHVLVPRHLDQKAGCAIHRLSVVKPIAHAQASAQA